MPVLSENVVYRQSFGTVVWKSLIAIDEGFHTRTLKKAVKVLPWEEFTFKSPSLIG